MTKLHFSRYVEGFATCGRAMSEHATTAIIRNVECRQCLKKLRSTLSADFIDVYANMIEPKDGERVELTLRKVDKPK